MAEVSEVSDGIRKAFRAYDLNDDGIVEVSELAALLQALDSSTWTTEKIEEFVKQADMNDDGMLQYEELVGWLESGDGCSSDVLQAGISVADVCPASMTKCKYGDKCYNRNPAHRRKFWHPDHEQLEGRQRQACKFGAGCYRRSRAHLEVYAHPGDRNYRKDIVVFRGRTKPQFETVQQMFDYFDADESGYLTREDFGEMLQMMSDLGYYSLTDSSEEWVKAGGEASGYLNFARVAAWSSDADVSIPVGLKAIGDKIPCHFRMAVKDGWTCSCENFEPDQTGKLCQCGHKQSAHRSVVGIDEAESILSAGLNWKEGETGLVEVTDDESLMALVQEMLTKTHKETDNWTRDRGCSIHGRAHPDCPWSCIRANSNPVPTGFTVKRLYRNQNSQLWIHYAMMKRQIMAELAEPCDIPYEAKSVLSLSDLDSPLSFEECNEWRLYHGTSLEASNGICATNFRLSLSGTGATWKEEGAEKGSPLYGFGIYLGESITKSDEYAGETEDGLNVMLICRAVGGRTNVCESNEIDKQKLKDDVFNGPYHSVFGDRVAKLGKPYRELVLYDKDQIFPEFLVHYERRFD